ncbi:MAG: DUF5717 family protein [Lachnospiraceae bacterium]
MNGRESEGSIRKAENIMATEGGLWVEDGLLRFSCDKIELSLGPGETYEGSFVLGSADGSLLDGQVRTVHSRMICLNGELAGSRTEIRYLFNAQGMESGSEIKGSFRIISTLGEYSLPYHVSIEKKVFQSSIGPVRNLFHFANLAKTSWREAVSLFYSEDFIQIFEGNDRQYRNVYRGLSVPPEKEQRVEEFLLQVKKKQPVEYFTDQEGIQLTSLEKTVEESLALTKDGWGYVNLYVELNGDFLSSEKMQLSDNDFLGNVCHYPVLISHDRLHGGRNFGSVRFYNEYVSVEVPVCVTQGEKRTLTHQRNRKQRLYELVRYFVEFGMERITRKAWLEETEKLLDSMEKENGRDIVQELLRVQLLLTQERHNEAKWVLDRVQGRMDPENLTDDVLCYNLYLRTLCGVAPEKLETATGEIRYIYDQNQGNWRIAWILYYLDTEMNRSVSRKWVFLEHQFEMGCHSPVWYMEAAALIRENSALLLKLTPFVVQVLNFMAKYDCLTDEIISQIHYLASGMKQYSERMLYVLKVCYEHRQDDETLRAICALLIKGNKTGPQYVHWYREGVKRELRITRLYEYYMMSVDLRREEVIPRIALLYFAYHSELPWEQNAYLYAYVIRNKEEYPELYRSYLPDMERFLEDQLARDRYNENVACICRELLQTQMMGEGVARECASARGSMCVAHTYERFFFGEKVTVGDARMRRVIVVHGKLKEEESYPVSDGVAYVPVYSGDAELLLEDGRHNRFSCSIPCQRKSVAYPVLEHPEFEKILKLSEGGMLYLCEQGRIYSSVSEENAEYVRELLDREQITDEYHSEMAIKLLNYYEENDKEAELEALLMTLRPECMKKRDQGSVLRSLIGRGMYERALAWVERFDVEGCEPKMLVRLAGGVLPYNDFRETPVITDIAKYTFDRGKYNENILRYLEQYYQGTSRELRDIWLACERFEVENSHIGERLLRQMLFSGEFVKEEGQIFDRYLETEGITETAVRYLSHLAYQYFVRGRLQGRLMFDQIRRMYRDGDALEPYVRLAMLKYLSDQEQIHDADREMIQKFVGDLMIENGIFFEFFRKFSSVCPEVVFRHDRTVLMLQEDTDNPVFLHYIWKNDDAVPSQSRAERLRRCLRGVYTKEFVLFFGESVQYYIMEERDGQEKLSGEGTLKKSDTDREYQGSRFNMINDFVISVTLQQHERAVKVVADYEETAFLTEQLFTLV